LVEENHRKKVALVAVMRKLVIAANYSEKNLILCLQINTVDTVLVLHCEILAFQFSIKKVTHELGHMFFCPPLGG